MKAAPQAKSAAMPAPFTPAQAGLLQRKCACGGTPGRGGECEECRKKPVTLQRRAASPDERAEVPPIVHDVLRSPGQPLDPPTREFMESRFGHDFSRVRVHTDAKAAESARAVSALAYTLGRGIVFGAGHYAPTTQEGKRLLAHELAHAVQQETGVALQPHLESSPSEDLDQEASHAADAILSNEPVRPLSPASYMVQREAAGPPDAWTAGVPAAAGPAASPPTVGEEPEPTGTPTFPVTGKATCFCDVADTGVKGGTVACGGITCPDEKTKFAAWPNLNDRCKKITKEGPNVPRVTCGSTLKLTYGKNTVEVTVKDCGPNRRGRVIDLSLGAAKALDSSVKTCADWGVKDVSVTT